MTYSRPWMYFGLTLMAFGASLLWHQNTESIAVAEPVAAEKPAANTEKPIAADAKQQPAKEQEKSKTPWKELFNGKTLDGWIAPQLGGEGKVYVKDDAIVLEMGSSMTAIKWTGEVIRNNYELALEGMRLDGCDFFCTTTFPVGDDPCSLVVGGWGGSVVGLSNIDHFDASENPTTKMLEFKEKKWYRVRIRVSDSAIQAWIDDKLIVNQGRKGHKIGIRLEVDECRPLGIATWYTKGAVRNIRVRPLTADEVRLAEVELGASNDN